MAKNTEQLNSNTEEESLKELILQIQDWIKYLWRKKWIVIIVGLMGGVIGLVASLLSTPTYSAKVSFVLEDSKSGGGSSLGGLAAMAGINLGGGGGGLFQGDNILELYKSRSMLTKTLLSSTDSTGPKALLIDRYIEMKQMREKWEDKGFADINFHGNPKNFSRAQDSIIGKMVKNIRENMLTINKPDKMMNQITVETKSPDELFSKYFTESLVQNVTDFYVETRTKKSKENVDVLQFQVDSVRKALNEAIKDVAVSNDFNLNPARQNLRVGSAQRQVDIQANEAILKELVKNLELAKVSFRKDSPLIQVIDYPVLPLEQEQLGKKKGIILGGLISGFLIVMVLIGRKYYRDIMTGE